MLDELGTRAGAGPTRAVTPIRAGIRALTAPPPAAVPPGDAPVSHRPRLAGAWRDPFVWAISLAVLAAYLVISLSRLARLDPASWDLAIYTEYVKQVAGLHAPVADVRGPGFNMLGDHFQPIVMAIAPLFWVFGSAAALLVGQALLVALSVFAVAQAARDKLGPGPSRAVALAYGFSWGLQQLVSFDFHELAFAVPLLAFSLSALVRGHLRAAVWWAVPLVFVKEDQGFTVAAIGLYLVLSGLRGTQGGRRVWAGQFLLIWGFAWSFLSIGVIIPHLNPDHVYAYWANGGIFASGGHLSVAGLAGQLAHAWPDKLQTVVALLLPTAFIAAGSPLALIAVPGLLLRFTGTQPSYWGTGWHYNAPLMPVLFIAAVDALARIGAAMDAYPGGGVTWASGRAGLRHAVAAGARRYGAAMMVAIVVVLAFQFPLSDLWHAGTYRTSAHVASAEAAMARVPDGATVQATLDLLAPLAARTDTFWIGNRGNPRTRYIVFDGQNSGYVPAITNVPAFIAELYPGHVYTEIFASGGVYVFRRS
jgi:uncharacterized membrane protein